MNFDTKEAAAAYRRREENMIPALRGRLRVVSDTATSWCRKTGEPERVAVWTVVMR